MEQHQHQRLLTATTTASLLAVTGIILFYRHANGTKKEAPIPAGAVRPPHVQSWIPYLGSAIAMGGGILQFIRQKSKELNSAVFTATILGDKCVFFGDPEHLNLVFKSKYTKFLDTQSLQKDFTKRVMGLTDEEMKDSFSDEVYQIGKSQYHHFLFKPEELNKSTARVQKFFLQVIPNLVKPEEEWTQHGMFSMVFSAVFKATVGPFISEILVNDESFKSFREFDKGVIPMFNNVPKFFIQKACQARANLKKLLESPQFWENGAASPWMEKRRQELPLSLETLQKVNLGILWASIGNSAPAIYWVLIRLIENKEAWEACRLQVDEVVAKRKDGSRHDVFLTVDDLDELTFLESAFWEALRLYQANFTARRVLEDFVLETKTQNFLIEKGSKLLPCWALLHQDPYIFEKPEEFQFDRFVDKTTEYTFQSGGKVSFFPVVAFGGGEHLCPGRKFVSYEARLLLALLMLNFDMRLAQGESIPDVDLTMQGIGVSHPAREVTVEIRKRESL